MLINIFDIYAVINENDMKLFYIYTVINENNMRKKVVKYYYVGVNKANNSIIICSTKAELGRFVGLSSYKLSQLIGNTKVADTELYTLWSRVVITKINRGFSYK